MPKSRSCQMLPSQKPHSATSISHKDISEDLWMKRNRKLDHKHGPTGG